MAGGQKRSGAWARLGSGPGSAPMLPPTPGDLNAARSVVRRWKDRCGVSISFQHQDLLERYIMDAIACARTRGHT